MHWTHNHDMEDNHEYNQGHTVSFVRVGDSLGTAHRGQVRRLVGFLEQDRVLKIESTNLTVSLVTYMTIYSVVVSKAA